MKQGCEMRESNSGPYAPGPCNSRLCHPCFFLSHNNLFLTLTNNYYCCCTYFMSLQTLTIFTIEITEMHTQGVVIVLASSSASGLE